MATSSSTRSTLPRFTSAAGMPRECSRPTGRSHPSAAPGCDSIRLVVQNELRGELFAEGLRLGEVLDVRGNGPGSHERDVRDAAARSSVARVRIDTELLGARVRGLADDHVGPGVPEHGILKLVIVNHRNHGTAFE